MWFSHELMDTAYEDDIEAENKALRKVEKELTHLEEDSDEYILAEQKKQGGKSSGSDTAVAEALKQQLTRKGIKY